MTRLRVSDRGNVMDANFTIEPLSSDQFALYLDSRSGAKGTPTARNTQYEPALDILLSRMADLGVVVDSVALAPANKDTISDLSIPGRPFPWMMNTPGFTTNLGPELRRIQATTDRVPGAKGMGNHTKRIRVLFRLAPKNVGDLQTASAYLQSGERTASATIGDSVSRKHQGSFGQKYRPPDESATVKSSEPFSVDPALVERGVRGHAQAQNRLARHLVSLGVSPRSPAPTEPDFDIGWIIDSCLFVAEVKSITDGNEEKQLRLGLGQVLRYVHQLREYGYVRPLLITEREPRDKTWEALCGDLGITLAWPEVFPNRITATTGPPAPQPYRNVPETPVCPER